MLHVIFASFRMTSYKNFFVDFGFRIQKYSPTPNLSKIKPIFWQICKFLHFSVLRHIHNKRLPWQHLRLMRIVIMCKMTSRRVRLNLKNFILISCAILELLRKCSEEAESPPGKIGLRKHLTLNNIRYFYKSFDTMEYEGLHWIGLIPTYQIQFVVTNGIQPDIFELSGYGVPQGSVLGPILFLLFINDIHNSLDNIIIKLFADDTNCFVSGNDFNSLERLAETEPNKLQKWINANKLTINFDPKRSSYCIFKPRNKRLRINFNRGLTMSTKVLTL